VKLPPYLELFSNRRVSAVLFLGFASGLPLALTGGTLQAWLAVASVDMHTIGLFAAVGLPYTLKFLWAPFMDRYAPPILGRRRGWMLLTQIALILGIALMGAQSPERAPFALAAIALLVAFFSASQDVVFDAYRTDVLHKKERGAGAAVSVLGYRLGMIVSGAVALILADQIGWEMTYWIMAGLMLIGLGATLFAPQPEQAAAPPKSLDEAIWGPLRDIFSRDRAIQILLLIVLYKLGDAFAGTLTTAFLLRGVGFTLTEVGAINKGLGLAATILGALFGGALMFRLGLYRALLYFGILQAFSNLVFMVLALTGKSYAIMVLAVGIENLCGGMGTAAFVVLLMALCNRRFSATQYALLSALASIGRVFVGLPSGYVVEGVGWANFFLLTFLTALPGLIILRFLRGQIVELEEEKHLP
jgi:MFS transporter, PAT family, beta-lactamase induction signal transducer AmpG